VKPEVAAPGQYFVASSALNASGWRDSTGNYRLFNGTSAATPYTAGVVALLLGKQRGLTAAQIKELIRQHAGRDDIGPVPNRRYGHGRLDANAVDEMLQKLPIL
jgi:serine protease AprX